MKKKMGKKYILSTYLDRCVTGTIYVFKCFYRETDRLYLRRHPRSLGIYITHVAMTFGLHSYV